MNYHLSDRANVAFIGYNEKHIPIAYGLVTYDDHLSPWVSGGILPAHRGRGYGTHLFRFLSTEWHMPVYLEVLESNMYALKLYTSLGFQEIGRKSIVDTMKNGAIRMEIAIIMKKAVE
jgi:ribosomal protein S18 acetylase RimI-like enzyme